MGSVEAAKTATFQQLHDEIAEITYSEPAMTDKQYLSNLVLYSKIEASKDKSSAIREEFFDTAERKAAESLDNPTFDLYDRYMELAARAKANAFDNFSSQSLSNAGFSELIESTREGDAQRRRIWIAWIVAIDETYRQSRSAAFN